MNGFSFCHSFKNTKTGTLKNRHTHGCCWETLYIFAYCGLVGNPPLTAKHDFCSPSNVNQELVHTNTPSKLPRRLGFVG